jgi:hypothetical protein
VAYRGHRARRDRDRTPRCRESALNPTPRSAYTADPGCLRVPRRLRAGLRAPIGRRRRGRPRTRTKAPARMMSGPASYLSSIWREPAERECQFVGGSGLAVLGNSIERSSWPKAPNERPPWRRVGRFRPYRASLICQIPNCAERRSSCPQPDRLSLVGGRPQRPPTFFVSQGCGCAQLEEAE